MSSINNNKCGGARIWHGFNVGIKGKAARKIWYAIKHTTGTPPTILEYHPSMPPYVKADGEQVKQRATWVVHHEESIYKFSGASKRVVEEIEANGLGEPEEASV